jgi:hypothetical protein
MKTLAEMPDWDEIQQGMQRPLKSVLIIVSLAFICVTLMVALHGIHLAPAEPALQQDRAELARLETQARLADAQSNVPNPTSPNTASNEQTDGISAQPKEQSPPPQSRPLAGHIRTARTSLALPSDAKEQQKWLKRSQERQTERALQRQRALAASRQRFAQQEPGSLFSSIARALGFSGH